MGIEKPSQKEKREQQKDKEERSLFEKLFTKPDKQDVFTAKEIDDYETYIKKYYKTKDWKEVGKAFYILGSHDKEFLDTIISPLNKPLPVDARNEVAKKYKKISKEKQKEKRQLPNHERKAVKRSIEEEVAPKKEKKEKNQPDSQKPPTRSSSVSTQKTEQIVDRQKTQQIEQQDIFGKHPTENLHMVTGIVTEKAKRSNLDMFPNQLFRDNQSLAARMRLGEHAFLLEKFIDSTDGQVTTGEALTTGDYKRIWRQTVRNDTFRSKKHEIDQWQEELYIDEDYGQDFFQRCKVFNNPAGYKKLLGAIFNQEVEVAELTPGNVDFDKENFLETLGYIEGTDWREKMYVHLNEAKNEIPGVVGEPINKAISRAEKEGGEKKFQETVAPVESLLEKADQQNEPRRVTIQNNFEAFENLFDFPVVGSMMKETFIPEEADKPGERYYEKKQSHLAEQRGLNTDEQALLDNLMGRHMRYRKTRPHEPQSLKQYIGRPKWFTSASQTTQEAVARFDLSYFTESILDPKQHDKLQDDLGQDSSFANIDIFDYLSGGVVRSTRKTEGTKTRKELYANAPTDERSQMRYQQSLGEYAAETIGRYINRYNVEFETPDDVARYLFIDLLRHGRRFRPVVDEKDLTSLDEDPGEELL